MGVAIDFSKYLESMQVDAQQYVNHKQMVDLLSIDRAQKLDLLMHLIINLQQPLILQGALGVGKTTLLSALELRKVSSVDIFLLSIEQQVSFEAIQSQIIDFIKNARQLDYCSLADALDAYAQKELQLVLVIDDADQLVPGLMGMLIDYASKYQALRLVFALTSEAYKEKSQREKIQANCHFVELPVLNIRQCGAFIRSLVEEEISAYTIKDIDSTFVSEVYQKTKGNPGEISTIIRTANKKGFANGSVLTIAIVIVFICSALVSVFLWQEPKQENSKLVPAPDQPAVKLIKLPSEMVVRQKLEVKVSPELKEQKLPFEQKIIEAPVVISAPSLVGVVVESRIDKEGQEAIIEGLEKVDELIVSAPLVKQVKGEVIKKKKAKDSIMPILNIQDDRQWVLAQKKRQYTLQLMVLSAKDNLLEEQKKYLSLGVKTFYLEKQVKDSKAYILFHGVFASIDEAKKKMQKLPKALQESWPRAFSAIQKDL